MRARHLSWMLIAVCAVAAPAAAQTVGGLVSASWGSGNTVTTDELSLANLAVQGVGPVQNASPPGAPDPGGVTEQAAEAAVDLGQGVLAAAAGTDAVVLDFGPNRYGSARASLDYAEVATVASASLAPGTLVAIRLRYRVAFGADALHSLDPVVVDARSDQSASAAFSLYAFLQDLEGGNQSSQSDWLHSVGGTPTETGILADPTQPGELAIQEQVGDTIRLGFSLDATASSQATVYAPNLVDPPLFPTAATGATIALVFGVESDPPGATVVSPLLGGALPGLANASAANAIAQVLPLVVGAPVTVPEPDASRIGVAALLVLARRRGRRPREPRRAG